MKRATAEFVALIVLAVVGWAATVLTVGATVGAIGLVAWHVFRWLS